MANHHAVADGVLHTVLSQGPSGLVVLWVVSLRCQVFGLHALAAVIAIDHPRRCILLRAHHAGLLESRLLATLVVIVVD